LVAEIELGWFAKIADVKFINIQVSKQFHDELKRAATRKQTSLSELVRIYCKDGLERSEGLIIKEPGDDSSLFS